MFEQRMVPAYAVRNAFVFHHKGGTLPVMEGRENIRVCHANWKSASVLPL